VVVERICTGNNLTQKDIASEIGVAPETITRWKADFSPPFGELVRTLAVLRRYEPDLGVEDLGVVDAPALSPDPATPSTE